MSNETNMVTAPVTEAAKPIVKQPTSEKLTALKADYKAALILAAGFDDPFSAEARDAKLAMAKLDGDINAEIAAIKKAEHDAVIAEAKNQRTQLAVLLRDAAIAFGKLPKNATAEQTAASQSAMDTTFEDCVNELIKSFGTSKPANNTANGEKSDGGRDTANKANVLAEARSGKSHKEIEAATGVARSTVWHIINKAKIAGETFPNV